MTKKQRLDHFLSRTYPDISRGFLQKLINTDQVLVNGQPRKSGYRIDESDDIKLLYDIASIGKVPEIDLPVIYEDDDVLVIDKPAGVLSHALTKFHNEPSVASFLRQHMKTVPNGDIRFGIVHRLDRVTSGVMICAKNHQTLTSLQAQFQERRVNKTYYAVVSGRIDEQFVIDVPLERNPKAPASWRPGTAGKPAQTLVQPVQHNNGYTLVELKPKTGRTHQLRVHMKHIGHPIVGDDLYGGEPADRLFLHAGKLELIHHGKKQMFESQIPSEFTTLVT